MSERKKPHGRPSNPAVPAIMEQFGCSRATAYRIVRQAGTDSAYDKLVDSWWRCDMEQRWRFITDWAPSGSLMPR